ncbi:unnamed protein product [Calypogeia fissa]
MGPKKKGKKGKKKKAKEPKRDSGWNKTIQNGKWERPYESLPSTEKWPAWGELREEMFAALKVLTIIWSENLGDDFILELFAVPLPNLVHLELRGSKLLTKFILSPETLSPSITFIDISCCPNLTFVLIQSDSLKDLTLARSFVLEKVLLQTRTLKSLILCTCPLLDTLMVWSNDLVNLNLLDCKEITILELYCPKLTNLAKNDLKVIPADTQHEPPILYILQQLDLRAPIKPPEFGYPDANTKDGLQSTRPLVPRTLLCGF